MAENDDLTDDFSTIVDWLRSGQEQRIAGAKVPPPANPFVSYATSPGFAPVGNQPAANGSVIPAPPAPPQGLGFPTQMHMPRRTAACRSTQSVYSGAS